MVRDSVHEFFVYAYTVALQQLWRLAEIFQQKFNCYTIVHFLNDLFDFVVNNIYKEYLYCTVYLVVYDSLRLKDYSFRQNYTYREKLSISGKPVLIITIMKDFYDLDV